MAQTAKAQVPATTSRQQLVVFSEKHPILAPLATAEIVEQVNYLLRGSPLTFNDLFLDLGNYLSVNTKIQKYAKPEGLYNCLTTAARHQTTFGDGGMWCIPESDQLRPQESARYIESRADEAGWTIRVVVLHDHNEPVEVVRNEYGEIESFTFQDDLAADCTERNMVGAMGVAIHTDGNRRIEWFDSNDLDRRKQHSAALSSQSGSPMWSKDPLKGHERSVRAAMGRWLVPIRTRSPGKVGSIALPGNLQTIDGEFAVIDDQPTDSSTAIRQSLDTGIRTPAPEPEPIIKAASRADLAALLPGPESFSEKTQTLVKGGGLVKRVHDAMAKSFLELVEMPDALAILRQEQGPAWGGEGSEAELLALRELRNVFWEFSKAAGYPQS